MANQNNQKANNTTGEQVVNGGQPVQNPNGEVPAQPETPQVMVVQQPTVVPEQKQGIGTWCKQHWKGLVASVTGVLAIGGTAVAAYKRGKAVGIMSVPMPPQAEAEDYSLDPNRE